jgi:hypothetical protein
MFQRKNRKPFFIVALTVVLLLAISSIAMAAVWTDQPDYTPGSPVIISGNNDESNAPGYYIGGIVKVSISGPSDPAVAENNCQDVVVGEGGNWSCIVILWADPELSVGTYIYTVTSIDGDGNPIEELGTFTDGNPVHNVNFATSGLPSGVSITVNWTKTNPAGHSASGSTIFTSPGPSGDEGTTPGTAFTYSFPASATDGSDTYDLSGTSPTSGFLTGVDKGYTTVTGTYVKAAPQTKDQTITFPAIADKTYGDADFDPEATASSGLSVSYSASGNCTIVSGMVHLTGAGSCTITASQAGNDEYNPAEDVSQSFDIAKADATCSISVYNDVYDAAYHGASGTCSGIGGEAAGTLDLGATYKDVPGGTAHWVFTGNDNYNNQSGDVAITITKADATCLISGWSGVFDNTSHGASGSCSGIDGESAGTLDFGETYKYPPGGTAHWVFTGNGNYKDQNGDVSILIIAWHFEGFFQPVDMNGVFNVVKGGSTVPLKFQVFAGDTEITDTNAIIGFTYGTVECNSSAISDNIETLVTGGTSLRYDFTAGQFVYNWKTPKTPGCFSLVMTTLDHSTLIAYFIIK